MFVFLQDLVCLSHPVSFEELKYKTLPEFENVPTLIIVGKVVNLHKKYNWLEWDGSDMSGKLINLPPREDIPENINEQLIVELYSK